MNVWEVDKLILFIAFVIPGFISIKVYELINPGEAIDSSKKLVDAITYSCLNYSVLFVPIYYIERVEFYLSHPNLYVFFYFSVLIISPMALSYGLIKIRKLDFFQNNAPHPVKKPWDFVFQKRDWYWVIIELNDGSKVAGKYAGDSFASSYPASEQIFLEERWHLDEDDSLDRPRGGTAGILIGSDHIKTIEFFVFDNGGESESETETGTESGE